MAVQQLGGAGEGVARGYSRTDITHARVGRQALEAAVLLAGPLALLGPAASDIYLSVSAAGFLLWRMAIDARPSLDLLPAAAGRERECWFRAPWFLAAVGFWLWSMISALVAGDHFGDAASWIRFPVFAAALGLVIGRDVVLRTRLLQSMLLGAAMMAAILFVERMNDLTAVRLYGPWDDPKPGWYMFGVGLPATLWAVVWLERRGFARDARTGFAVVALALFPLAAFTTGEVMIALLYFIGMALTALFIGLSPARLLALSAILAGVAALMVTQSEEMLWRYGGEFWQRLPWRETSDYHNGWIGALNMGLERWLLGAGPGGFGDACRAMTPEALGVANCIAHPHQLYLQAFAETGLPGLAMFAAATALMAAHAFGRWRTERSSASVMALALLLTVFLPLATYSDGFGQHKNFFTWLCAGWALALLHAPPPRRRVSRR